MAQILRVSIRGTIPGGEVWSTNPCWEINGSGGSPVSPSQALTIATALGQIALPAGITQSWAAHTALTGFRVEARSLAGVLETQAEYVKPVAVAGSGTVILPVVTALTLSLRTPGVGPSARGRLYFPLTSASLATATSRVGGSQVTSLLAAYKAFLLNMETAIQATLPNANLTVWSRTTENFHNVNSLQLGDVPDVQRRRRDQLIEAYQSGSFP